MLPVEGPGEPCMGVTVVDQRARTISWHLCHPEEDEPLSPTQGPGKNFLSNGDQCKLYLV